MDSMELFEGKYIGSMDLYPQQAPEFNRVFPFYENLKAGRFTTTRCKDCGHRAFPPRVLCPECLSENLDWVDLPKEAKVMVVTEEEVGVPLGFETPLIHALVEVDERLKLFTRIVNVKVGELKEGDTVRLHVFPVPPVLMEKGRDTIKVDRVYYAFQKA
jgi:uncharacterized protein